MDAINRVLIELYRSARESPIREFQERAIALVRSVCRFESAVDAIGSLDPATGAATFHDIFLHNISDEFIPAHDEIAAEDTLASHAAQQAGRVFVFNTRDLMPARKFPRVAAFEARFEMRNTMGQFHFDPSVNLINGLLLWRGKGSDRFSEDERRLGEVILPHLIEARTHNQLIWLSELTASSIARRGVRAIASVEGVLYTHDATFLDLLKLEWPEWSPPILPPALMGARSDASQRYSGTRISVVAELKQGMLFLLAREKKGIEGLTPAQLAVARLIARGCAYKETAAELGVSVATVRNHLSAIYQKIGVDNATGLAHWLAERGAYRGPQTKGD